MCGIIGTSDHNLDLVKKAIGLLAHRGPDHEGLFTDGVVALGHRRLSIIDLTASSNQPIVSDDGNYVIVFNGEIYNFSELRDDLKKQGVVFKSNGDTEVILRGYIHQGTSFFSRLRGMWAFAIYDKTKSLIVLSRDHFGIKPLYYGVKDNNLFFASEMKALKQMGLGQAINSKHYYQFFNLGYFIAPHTPYADIFKAKPGEILVWDINNKKLSCEALDLSGANESSLIIDQGEAVKTIDQAIHNSVEAHFVADTPVGILLSGGNDSSLLAAVAKDLGKNPTAYHLRVQGSTDTYYADRVARHLGLNYESIEMNQQALEEQYEKLETIMDEPTGDTSIIPTSLIYSLIGKKTKVVLSGEGGDELFGGYLRHAKLLRHKNIFPNNSWHTFFDRLMSGTTSGHLTTINPIVGKVRNAFLSGAVTDDLIWTYLQQVKIADFPIESSLMRQDMHELWATKKMALPANLFFDAAMYLPNNLMYKNDISSMASSIEARVPFLDKEFFAATAKLDPNLRLSSTYQSKKILKEVMLKYLPKELVYRDKKGFGFRFSSYNKEVFLRDGKKAFRFHRDHAQDFGIGPQLAKFIADANVEIVLDKYPRFAFALITNWLLMRK